MKGAHIMGECPRDGCDKQIIAITTSDFNGITNHTCTGKEPAHKLPPKDKP